MKPFVLDPKEVCQCGHEPAVEKRVFSGQKTRYRVTCGAESEMKTMKCTPSTAWYDKPQDAAVVWNGLRMIGRHEKR